MNSWYKIKNVKVDEQERVRHLRYAIYHSGQSYSPRNEEHITTLDQELELRCSKGGSWSAYMAMKDLHGCSSPERALGQLGNWLERMGEAVNELRENLEMGLKNPLSDESTRYTLQGLIKALEQEKCPLQIDSDD